MAQYGFEDSTTQGWVAFNNASTPVNSTAAAHTGSQSLPTTTNSTGGSSGPSIRLTNLVPGASYQITGFVMLISREAATAANLTVVRTDPGCSGGTCFDTIGTFQVPVSDSGWAQVGGTYTVSTTETSLVLYTQLVGPTAAQSFYLDDVVINQISGPPGGPQANSGISTTFEDGTLDGWSFLAGAVLTNTTADARGKHFDSLVSGNDMKWDSIEPQEGNFSFTTADAEVAFAQAHSMLVRGHNLVWANGSQTPAWVFREADGVTPLSASNPADVALLTQRIQNHIKGEVQHFGSAIYVWDVVNEPLDPGQSDCLSHGLFYQVLGPSYLEIALRAARQFAPAGTQLFINDFSTTDPKRLACLISVVARLRLHKIPLDGVGHEMHNHIDNPSPLAMFVAIDALAIIFPHLHQQVLQAKPAYWGIVDPSQLPPLP